MTNPKHSHSDSIILPGTDTSAAWTARGLAATLAAIQLVATWPAQEHGREGAGTAPLLETFPGCCTYHFCSHPELSLMPHEILRPGKRLKSRQSSLIMEKWENRYCGTAGSVPVPPCYSPEDPEGSSGQGQPTGALASSS